jgi:hypothetical protein
LIQQLEKMDGKPHDPSPDTQVAVTNIICAIIFGERYDILGLSSGTGHIYCHFLSHLRLQNLCLFSEIEKYDFVQIRLRYVYKHLTSIIIITYIWE